MRKFKFSYLLVMQIIFYLFLFRSVFAFTIAGTEIDPIKIVFGPEVPPEWYDMYLFMQWLVFPFIGIWMVIYGILEELRIFRRKASIQGILALVMAFIASSSGILVAYVARPIFMLLGGWGLIVFFVVFFFGAFLWGWGSLAGQWSQKEMATGLIKDIKDVDLRIDNLRRDVSNIRDAAANTGRPLTVTELNTIRAKEDEIIRLTTLKSQLRQQAGVV